MFGQTILKVLVPVAICFQSCQAWSLPGSEYLYEFAQYHDLTAIKVFLPFDAKHYTNDLAKHFKSLSIRNTMNIPIAYIRQNGQSIHQMGYDPKDLCVFIPGGTEGSSEFDRDFARSIQIFKDLISRRLRSNTEHWLLDISNWRSIQEVRRDLSDIALDLDDDMFLFNVTRFRKLKLESYFLWEMYKIHKNLRLTIKPLGRWMKQYAGPFGTDEKWIRRRNLQGVTLKAYAVKAPPYIMEMNPQPDGSWKFKGMIPDIMQSLQESMNFTLQLTKSPLRSWGSKLSNGTWVGLVGFLSREDIDIAPQDITITLERSEVADFTEPFIQYYTRVFLKNPVGTYNFIAYLEPLHYLTWVFTLLVCLVAPPVLALTTRFGGRDPAFLEFTLSKCYVFLLSILTTRGWSDSPKNGAPRVAFLGLLIFALMLYKHWEAMLVSYLATRVIVLPFTNIETLVKDSNYRISTNPGSLIVDKFRNAIDPVWKEAWTDRMEPYLDTYEGSVPELINLVLTVPEMSLYADYRKISSTVFFRDCEIIAAPAKYDLKPNAFGLQKNSPYLGIFNFYIRRLVQTGTLNKILTNYESPVQICPDYSGKALGMNSCFTAFFPLFFAAGLALVLFVLEWTDKRIGLSKTLMSYLWKR